MCHFLAETLNESQCMIYCIFFPCFADYKKYVSRWHLHHPMSLSGSNGQDMPTDLRWICNVNDK